MGGTETLERVPAEILTLKQSLDQVVSLVADDNFVRLRDTLDTLSQVGGEANR